MRPGTSDALSSKTVDKEEFQMPHIKIRRFSGFILAGSLALAIGGYVPGAFAQAPAPTGSLEATTSDPSTVVGNNSGGTAPGPNYSGPASASGANSPPANSGLTDPKTGANNDTVPSITTNPSSGMPSGAPGVASNGSGMASH